MEQEPRLLCFGDSFGGVFKLLSTADRHRVHVRVFGGASARGLSNPHATVPASSEILSTLRRSTVPAQSTVVLVFGNVDLQMNYMFRLLKDPNKFDDEKEQLAFADTVAEAYVGWIRRQLLPVCREAQLARVCVATALAPVICDEMLAQFADKYTNSFHDRGNRVVASTRAGDDAVRAADWSDICKGLLAKPTGCIDAIELFMSSDSCRLRLRHRLAMHDRFNRRLAALVASLPTVVPVKVVDINQNIETRPASDGLTVDQRFISIDRTNVHLMWEPTVEFWVVELERAGVVDVPLREMLSTVDMGRSEAEYVLWKHKGKERIEAEQASGGCEGPRSPTWRGQKARPKLYCRGLARP